MHVCPSNFIILFSVTADLNPIVYIGHISFSHSSVGRHLDQCHLPVIIVGVAMNNDGECLCGGAQRGEAFPEGHSHTFFSHLWILNFNICICFKKGCRDGYYQITEENTRGGKDTWEGEEMAKRNFVFKNARMKPNSW